VAASEWVVELLAPAHNREPFDCGVDALNAYLRQYARQDMDRGVATPYVLVPVTHRTEIAGFYTLAASSIRLSDLPPATVRKLPRYPIVPATLLGRLAISVRHQGQRLGEYLLVDALTRTLAASAAVGSAAVIVDAKDDVGAGFYERYGFERFPEQPLRLFISMRTIRASRRT
jgi:predicted GNAT family N-acyltransferase